MRCPRCRGCDLMKWDGREAEVDFCATCGGIWFDSGELDRTLDVAARDLQPGGTRGHERTVLCPKCIDPMEAFSYPQTEVVIDMCRRCRGIWLEGEELAEIRRVRRALLEEGRLEEFAPVPGVKGALLRFIDRALMWMGRGFRGEA